ncbi:hypothetical protein [Eisenibacter elegans]|jgi:uncharacterized membrane protein|uniref:hypothetical protein n=1 Tax=Eisenibacter elegans TaxID=997 RepID=UPI00047BB71C|nr:hypothetical protein [Eisenibacter elegans]
MRYVFRVFVLALLGMLSTTTAWAQCAMCRATIESNISDGGAGLARGLNAGILYLAAFPYLVVLAIALLWYRRSRQLRLRSRRAY